MCLCIYVLVLFSSSFSFQNVLLLHSSGVWSEHCPWCSWCFKGTSPLRLQASTSSFTYIWQIANAKIKEKSHFIFFKRLEFYCFKKKPFDFNIRAFTIICILFVIQILLLTFWIHAFSRLRRPFFMRESVVFSVSVQAVGSSEVIFISG